MVNMMKALVFTAPHTFEYQDVPRPEPAPDEVLVEVKACAICGSDVHGAAVRTGGAPAAGHGPRSQRHHWRCWASRAELGPWRPRHL